MIRTVRQELLVRRVRRRLRGAGLQPEYRPALMFDWQEVWKSAGFHVVVSRIDGPALVEVEVSSLRAGGPIHLFYDDPGGMHRLLAV